MVLYMKDIKLIIKEMDKDAFIIPMEDFIVENGKKMKSMAKALFIILVVN